jgi:hypothetical protein
MTTTTEISNLLSLFSYNPLSGKFYNKHNQEIGTKTKRGYVVIHLNKKLYYAQILAYLHQEGHFPKHFLTFKDGNPQNLRYSNIEEVSKTCIARRITLRSTNTSGVTGVTFCNQTGKWKAYIYVNGKNRYQGRYDYFEEAVMARYLAEEKYEFLKDNPNSTAATYEYRETIETIDPISA